MKQKMYNLTSPQKNIWLVDMTNKDTSINVISGFVYVNDNEYDYNKNNFVINKLVKNNDGLRIRIVLNGSLPKQYIEKYIPFEIENIDLSNKSQKEILKYLKEDMNNPIDIYSDKLYEFKSIKYDGNKTAIMYRLHHIVTDAWSIMELASQFSYLYDTYQDKSRGIDMQVPSYAEYIENEQEYNVSDKYIKDKEFWKEYLNNIKDPVSIKEASRKITNKSKRYIVKLDNEFNVRVDRYCKENRISPYVLFMSAFATYIYRIKDANDFVVGTPVLNRSNFKEKQMLGMFVSTIPMRFNIEEGIKFIDFAKQVASDTMSIFRHQKYPYSKILQDIHDSTEIKNNLYSIALSYQNARPNYSDNNKYSAMWSEPRNIQDELNIHIVDVNNNGNIEMYYDYLVDLFTKIEIEYLHTRIIEIINDAIDNMEKTVDDVRIMSKAEENRILYEFNDTDKDCPKDKTIIEIFEDQVDKNPDKIAAIFGNKKITYKELNEKANQLANYIIEKNIESDIISIIQKRSISIFITILGIIKAGKAFLPIDSNFPDDRIRYMINNSESKFIIKSKNIDYKCDDLQELIIDEFEFDNYSNANLKLDINRDLLTYIIYTSGTTGMPKGVMISNSNLVNLVYAAKEFQNLKNENIFASFSSYSFDIFILETFLPFSMGKTIILSNEDEQLLPNLMSELLIKNKVEVLYMTPTRMRLLLDYDKKGDSFKNLKKVMLGGEIFPKDFYNKLRKHTKADIYDGYGPTEITVWSSAKLIENKDNINIGKSLPNIKSYIFDNKQRILPIGCVGELQIGGLGVGIGYYNNEEDTEKKFVKFDNKKLYKTGDYCYFDFNGDLNYLRRKDTQVKIHGYRIELGEIESIIRNFTGINEAVVIINKENHICAYFSSSIKIDINKLKNYIKKFLPSYMVPMLYKQVNRFKINVLGKIDRKSLPIIGFNKFSKKEPETSMEKTISSIVSRLIDIENIPINESIFELGLDSLKAIKLITYLGAKNINITYAELYDLATIEKICNKIGNNSKNHKTRRIRSYNYLSTYNILKTNKIENIETDIHLLEMRNVLLIGVTGFLGAHILDYLMTNENSIIYCIVRPKYNIKTKDRVRERLEFYFGEKYDKEIDNRIVIIEGDITQEPIITNKIIYKNIINTVDVVINCAAHVKHYGNEHTFKKINVDIVKNLARFCLKNNKKFIQASSLSVSGNMVETDDIKQKRQKKPVDFNESCLYVNQNLDNIYAYTKFLAEKYIIKEMEHGLDAKIFRIGNITGRYTDGKFQINAEENAFASRIKTITKIKKLPENLENFCLEFSPVDYVAKAIVELSKTDTRYNMFHILNSNYIEMKKLKEVFNKRNIDFEFIHEDEFSKLISTYIFDEELSKDIEGIIIDLKKNNSLDYTTNTVIRSEYTNKILHKIGFKWPIIDSEYIFKYMDDLKL